ncbi:MAG: response regulator [Kofleriaceae bacterium]|nr:response regulator [Kofleriaceae bacterium]
MASEKEGPQPRRIATFRQTATERLGRLNLAWVRFEQGEAGAGAEFMREAHTLTGEASLVGFGAIKRVTHHIETLVAPALESSGALDPSLGDTVLQGLDLLGSLLERAPNDPAPDAAAYVGEVQQAPAASPQGSRGEARTSPSNDSVRVTTENLEGIREIVGDLFLLHSRSRGFLAELRKARQLAVAAGSREGTTEMLHRQLAQVLGGLEAVLRDHGRQVGRTATMLETISRDMRMVPIRVLFDTYPRAVRSLARELDKEVRLQIEGDNIQVDRAVLDAIAEPLIHVVRNAIDHGLEAPAQREHAGKSREGQLRIHANLIGSTLRIEISDDGKGIDVDAVRRRVLELGLLGPDQVRQLTHDQLVSYVFHQGLSTMRTATEVSGRGVGLDVVIKNIEAMGGAVTVTTREGQGTTFRLQVPISIAVTALLTFRVGSGRYALPATSVVSLIESAKAPVIESSSGPVIRHEGFLVPVVQLDELLADPSSIKHSDSSARTILVESAGSLVALVGTDSHKRVEAVLKGASEVFRHDRLLGAAAPMDDGTLALVLKPGELLAATRGGSPRAHVPAAPQRGGSTVLVADDSPVIRDLLSEALRSHGLRVLEAADGEEALAILAAHPEVRLLVTDVEMPRLDGIGLIREVRLQHGRQLPTLVVSMRGTDEDKQRALDVGADGYLVKSDFTQAGLWSMVSRYLR